MSRLLSILWNRQDAERGLLLGLFASVWLNLAQLVFTNSRAITDLALLSIKFVPYSPLWVWLNPWNNDANSIVVYRTYLALFVTVVYAFQYLLVLRGFIPKFVYYLSFGTSIIWLVDDYPQNVTVTAFAPLATINPLFALLVLQKLPLGWSLIPWDNQHWACAFGQRVIESYCPSVLAKLDLNGYLLWYYGIVAFWFLMPILVWFRKRQRKIHSDKSNTAQIGSDEVLK